MLVSSCLCSRGCAALAFLSLSTAHRGTRSSGAPLCRLAQFEFQSKPHLIFLRMNGDFSGLENFFAIQDTPNEAGPRS